MGEAPTELGLGWLVWAKDPNDPEIQTEAIAGGIVVGVDRAPIEDGDERGTIVTFYTCARPRGRDIKLSRLREDQIVEKYRPMSATAEAARLYMAVIRNIAADKKPNRRHLGLLKDAVLAAEIAFEPAAFERG